MRGSQPWRTNRARALRSRQTTAEDILWSKLRNRRLGGHKFTRQAPVDPYFADFICRERRLIVEVDGATHGSTEELIADHRRDRNLKREGYRVFRVQNADIYANLDGVLETIFALLEGDIINERE